MPTKRSLKGNLNQKIFEEKSLPKKYFKQFLYQTLSQNSTKETLKIHSLPKNPKRNIYQTISQEIFPYQKNLKKHQNEKTSEEKSLPIKEETSPPKNLTNIITRNMAKIRTHEI